MSARLAAMVLARDRPGVTRRTLEALLAQDPPADVLLLIDNDATAEVRAALETAAAAHPAAEILRLAQNRGCAGGYEAGIVRLLERGDAELACGFDDDATPAPGCLAALRAAAESLPDVGAVGAVAHDGDGTLAWPMHVEGEREPLTTLEDVRALAARRPGPWPVHNLAWQGKLLPLEVLRRHGNVWGDLFLQYEDIELGLRLRRAGLRSYLVPDAECLHPGPPPSREIRVFGRQIEITAQSPAKEYLTLRNALVVRPRYDGARFWYGTGPLVLLRGLLSALALDAPRWVSVRHVFLRGIMDAVRQRLGPPPAEVTAVRPKGTSPALATTASAVASSAMHVATEAAPRLHLGCGERYLDGYVNIDYPPSEHTVLETSRVDVHADIRRLSYDEDSVAEIRLHHVFEHFDRPTALRLLIDWHHWLVPGGRLTIETPDIERCARAFMMRRGRRGVLLRHMFGSHEAAWAVHWDGWYEDRFRQTLTALGFRLVSVERARWRGTYNITVHADKAETRSRSIQLERARDLLRTSLVDDSPSERKVLEGWLSRLAT